MVGDNTMVQVTYYVRFHAAKKVVGKGFEIMHFVDVLFLCVSSVNFR